MVLYKTDTMLACAVLFLLCALMPGLSRWDLWYSAHMRSIAPTIYTILQTLRILIILSIFGIGKFGALTEEAFGIISDTVLRYMNPAVQVGMLRDIYDIDQRIFISIVAVTTLRVVLCLVYAVFTYVGQLLCGYVYNSGDLAAIVQLWRERNV